MVETVHATHERAKVVGNYGFDLPWVHKGILKYTFLQFGFFKQYSSLVVSKSIMAEIIPSYVDSQASLSATSPIPYLTITGVLARAGAPTNWLDITPFFNLQTTNTGYRYVPNILSQLVWTATTTYSSTGLARYGQGGSYHSVTTAQADAEADYDLPGLSYGAGQFQDIDMRILARLYGRQDFLSVTVNVGTQMPSATLFYEIGPWEWSGKTNYFLMPTPTVVNLPNGTNVMACATNPNRTITWTIGATNIPLPWATNDYPYARSDGWVLKDNWLLLKWDVPSGFNYGN
jgi:hypothetical protein